MAATQVYILDAGCGSVRDSKTFLHLGYRVKAFDASEALAKLARQHIGQPVRLATFNGFESDTAFEGIWPCASQLHVPAREFPAIFTKYAAMLKPTGRFYCSFKYGEEATLISLQFTPSCSTSFWPGNRIRGISLTDFKSSFQRILIFSQKWLSNMACLVALVCIALTLRAEPRPLTLAFLITHRITESPNKALRRFFAQEKPSRSSPRQKYPFSYVAFLLPAY